MIGREPDCGIDDGAEGIDEDPMQSQLVRPIAGNSKTIPAHVMLATTICLSKKA